MTGTAVNAGAVDGGGGAARRRRTKAVRQYHLEVMENSLADGMSATQIIREAVRQFGVQERTAWDDLAEVYRRWRAVGTDGRAKMHAAASFDKAVLRREMLFRKAWLANQLSVALAVEKDRCELEGLYPPRKVAPTNPEGDEEYGPTPLSVEERKAIITAFFARLGAELDPQLLDQLTAGGDTPS